MAGLQISWIDPLGGRPKAFKKGADVSIEDGSHHYQFKEMYTAPGANGLSAKDIVDVSYLAGLLNSLKILVNEQLRAAPNPRDRGLQDVRTED